MRAHQAPDAPDRVSFWQIITLSEVVSPTTVVDVLAVSGNNVLFGHGTGTGITSWRQVAMLEGAPLRGYFCTKYAWRYPLRLGMALVGWLKVTLMVQVLMVTI